MNKGTFPTIGRIKVETTEQSLMVQNRLTKEGCGDIGWESAVELKATPHFLYWQKDAALMWGFDSLSFESHPNPEYDMSIFELIDGEEETWDHDKWVCLMYDQKFETMQEAVKFVIENVERPLLNIINSKSKPAKND